VRIKSIIPKDTLGVPSFMTVFSYEAPAFTKPSNNDAVEIIFANGDKFRFYRDSFWAAPTPKDSLVFFSSVISIDFLQKLDATVVKEIRFLTKSYKHIITLEDEFKLVLPHLSMYILGKTGTIFFEMSDLIKHTVCDTKNDIFDANKIIDKKFLGKYSGEWSNDGLLYRFDLFIERDKSYFMWYSVNDPDEKTIRVKIQYLQLRPELINNTLIMDVCFDANNTDYTSGKRTFYLRLSEDGKVLYGYSTAFGRTAQMYGIKK
jgi:hypothetical protein